MNDNDSLTSMYMEIGKSVYNHQEILNNLVNAMNDFVESSLVDHRETLRIISESLLNNLGNLTSISNDLLLTYVEAISQTADSIIHTSNELLSNINFPDDDYVIVDEAPIKEIKIPDELTIPVGKNRVKISTSLLVTIIGIIVSIIISCSSSTSKLQEEQLQVLYEILESVEPESSTVITAPTESQNQ